MGTMYDVDDSPMIPIAGFGDHQVGMYLAGGVLAALYRARETGLGDQVTVSLLHTAIWDTALFLQCRQYDDRSTKYPVSRKLIANPLNVAHKTKDGYWVQFSMPRYDYYYPIFMKALGREDLVEDGRFFPQTALQDHLEAFYEMLHGEILNRNLEDVEKMMKEADLPYAVCQTWDQVLNDRQAWESDALTKVEFPNGAERTMVRTPVLFAQTQLPPYERAPFLGENTEEVLAWQGYSEEQIREMIAAGAAAGCKRIG